MLLLLAAALAYVTFTIGESFTASAESAARNPGAWRFWALFALAFASPLWLPALVPSQFVVASRIVRWGSALLVLVPLRFSASVLLHQYELYGSGNFAFVIAGAALILSAGCLLAVVVLVLPELQRKRARIA